MRHKQAIYVIDDEEGIRDSIRMMLERQGYCAIALSSAEEFLQAHDTMPASCIVCDVRLDGISGIDLHGKLNREGAAPPVILITGHGDIEMAVKAVKNGVFDFIEKPFDDQRLYNSVKQALAVGDEVAVRADLIAQAKHKFDDLTPRQRQVMQLLVAGLSNKEIGRRLTISPRTVETYRSFVMARMGADSLAHLVKMGILIEHGVLVDSPSKRRRDPT